MKSIRNQLCECGHIKSNHKEAMKEGVRKRGECEQWNCICTEYKTN